MNSLNGLTPNVLNRAFEVRKEVQSVLQDVVAPGDDVKLGKPVEYEDGSYATFKGQLGDSNFSRATLQTRDGQISSLQAVGPANNSCEGVNYSSVPSKATGMRSAASAAFAAGANILGGPVEWLWTKAMDSGLEKTATVVQLASLPLTVGSRLLSGLSESISEPGTRDEIYEISTKDGGLESFRFNANGTIQHNVYKNTHLG